jgi:hypothetical protein
VGPSSTRPVETIEEELRAVGACLFRALFSGPVRDRLLQSLSRLPERPGFGLRIQIRMDLGGRRARDRGELHRLPWELLFAPETAGFLALSRRTPVVRYLEQEGPVAAPTAARLLHVLVVASEPAGLPALDLARELRHLEGVAGSWWRGVRVSRLRGATLEGLVEACKEGRVDALHFMGHGTFDSRSGEGALVFEDERGGPAPVTGARLARELADFVPPLRFVVLNACRSAEAATGAPFAGVATALAEVGVPAIVAMQHPVSDRAALELSRVLYREIARGRPVELALAEARLAMGRKLPGSPEWATPALFLRARDGRLFRGASPGRRRRVATGTMALLLALSSGMAGVRFGGGGWNAGGGAPSGASSSGASPSGEGAPAQSPSLPAHRGSSPAAPSPPPVRIVRFGEPERLPELPGYVTVDAHTEAGVRYVRLSIAADGAEVIPRAVFGPETLDVTMAGRRVTIDVLAVDWPGESVRLRVQ